MKSEAVYFAAKREWVLVRAGMTARDGFAGMTGHKHCAPLGLCLDALLHPGMANVGAHRRGATDIVGAWMFAVRAPAVRSCKPLASMRA